MKKVIFQMISVNSEELAVRTLEVDGVENTAHRLYCEYLSAMAVDAFDAETGNHIGRVIHGEFSKAA